MNAYFRARIIFLLSRHGGAAPVLSRPVLPVHAVLEEDVVYGAVLLGLKGFEGLTMRLERGPHGIVRAALPGRLDETGAGL